MRSRTGNSLSTLIFMVPLLGVPLMAIFGVPQFVPVIASSVSDETTLQAGNRPPKSGVGESATATFIAADSSLPRGEPQLRDLFGSPSRPRRASGPVRESKSRGPETSFVETSLNADSWLTLAQSPALDKDASTNIQDLFGNADATANFNEQLGRARSTAIPTLAAQSEANSELSAEGLTWREAVRRLNVLGIQNFRLEPGSQLGEFYFACEFTPHPNARVTRRFEAEAKEPLLAVKSVLKQIDEWLTRR